MRQEIWRRASSPKAWENLLRNLVAELVALVAEVFRLAVHDVAVRAFKFVAVVRGHVRVGRLDVLRLFNEGLDVVALLARVDRGFLGVGLVRTVAGLLSFNNGLTVSQGPFYGIECCPKIHHTMGGVMINEKAEVISATTQKPIKGLYAGGEVTGGVHGASRLGTVAVIDALTFGMIAGENFAAMK